LAEALGSVDVAHFNPSAYTEKDPLTLSVEELLADVRLGVGALLTFVQAARPFMAAGGRITVTGSMAADKPWYGAASLGVQKAGVRNLVQSIDAALKDDGIRAVSVTVRGLLAKEGPFAPDNVAAALRAAIDQPEDGWRTEIPYAG
ncbi:MAG: SDR family oxidoreductase, partial [Nocardioidaceae bacterium]|nr:SDR family oxidoreductase [Nocardioidaceae bacterium]